MEVQNRNIVFRCGGRTLQRFGALAMAGNGRGRLEEVKEVFTRAAQVRRYRDRDGIGRKAGADNLAIEYPGRLAGLVDAFGFPYCGPLIEGARTQLITDPENFGAWTNINTPILTAGQADPFGGTGAYLIDDDDAALSEGKQQTITFTGDGDKGMAVFMKPNTAGVKSSYSLRDSTAIQDRLQINVTWTGGVPSVSTPFGVFLAAEPWTGGWYRFLCQATGVVAANSHQAHLRIGAASPTDVGSAYYFGANAWNAPYPSSYQGPGESAGVVDSLLIPHGLSTYDVTVLTRLARPAWADVSGTIAFPGIWDIGNAVAVFARLYFKDTSRNLGGDIQAGGTNSFPTDRPMPSDAELIIATQIKNIGTSGGLIANDIGPGYGASGTPASPIFSKYGTQNIRVGTLTGATLAMFGVLLDMVIARGLFTRAEMMAIP